MQKRPPTVRLTLILLGANAVLWLAFSVYIALGAHPSFGAGSAYRWPAAGLALLVAVALGALTVHLRNPRRPSYWLTVAFLAVMILAFLFDQFGLADLAGVAATALPLTLLVRDRSWYTHPGAPVR